MKIDLERWLLEEEAEELNAEFDRKEREIAQAYAERDYDKFIDSLSRLESR